MRRMAAVLVVAVLCLGGKYEVRSKTDEFTGNIRNAMHGNRLGCAKVADAAVSMDAQKYTLKKGEGGPYFSLFVLYEWTTWMFIEDDQPLTLIIDGELEELEAEGEVRTDTTARGVYERVMYLTDAAFLARLANANEVKIRVPGKKWNVDRCFDAKNFERFKDFVARFVEAPAVQ